MMKSAATADPTTVSGTTGAPRPAGTVASAWIFAGRYGRQLRRSPGVLVASAIQPIMFTLLFAFVLGGAIEAPGPGYVQYFLPGILVQTTAFIGLGATAAGLAEELRRGAVDRYRTMPVGAVGMLFGRTFADLVRTAAMLLIVVLLGVPIGLRFHGEPLAIVGGLAVLLLAGWAFCWLGALVALVTRSVEAAQTSALVVLFPLTFASSAYVPVASMPGPLAAFAAYNPFTPLVDTVRAALSGTVAGAAPVIALAWVAAFLLVAVPVSLRRLNRRGRP